MLLHTLNAPPSSSAFADCLHILAPGDALVLMGDGVYAALGGTQAAARLQSSGAELYLLQPDAAVAGVLPDSDFARVLDIEGLVALTERFERQLAWY